MPVDTIRENVGLARGITIAGYAGAVNGAAIDRKSADTIVIIPLPVLMLGASVTVTLQESANGSSGWTTVSGVSLPVASLPDGTQTVGQLVRMASRERYFRIVGGAPSTGTPIYGVLVLMGSFGSLSENPTTWLTNVL